MKFYKISGLWKAKPEIHSDYWEYKEGYIKYPKVEIKRPHLQKFNTDLNDKDFIKYLEKVKLLHKKLIKDIDKAIKEVNKLSEGLK